MLKLAKTESKKEMTLMKHKKFNDINIINNRNLTERNELYPLYNASNCRIQHKVVKKSNIINRNENKNKNQSKTLNKDKAQNQNLISIKNNNIINSMKNSTSPITSKKKKPLKKIVRVKVLKTSNSKNKNDIDKISAINNDSNKKKKMEKHKRAETETNNILKTTRDARVRKMLSMASDIFNLNKTATNLVCTEENFSPDNPKFYKTFYKIKKEDKIDDDINIIFEKKIKKIDKPILRKKLLNNIGRTIISTEKELEGFFNKTIDRKYIYIAKGGGYFMNLFHLDPNEQAEMNRYVASCPKRKLDKNYKDIFNNEIFPNIKKCHLMENITNSGLHRFCDSMISHYFEYSYGNETYNIISRCSKDNIQKFYDFCVEYYDSFRGWDELGGYMFYMLFQHIFQYMDDYINGRSKIKMMMIGGHDVTVAPLMNFLSGLNIIPRTHFPHYACNVVIELRKYGQDFYLEFYYNDILKYNNTLEIFKNTLDNTKYSNLYNYCGIPSYLNNTINNATNQTSNNQTVKNESKTENIKNETSQTINNQTVKNESKIENVNNETNNMINNQTKKNESKIENVDNDSNPNVNKQPVKNDNVTQKENQYLQNSTKEKETEKVEIIENNPNINKTNSEKNGTNLINNNNTLIEQNEEGTKKKQNNFMQKSFYYLSQKDKNFYIMVICGVVVIVTLVVFIIFVFIWKKRRKKRYIKFKESIPQNVNPNNLSVISSNDSKIKSEPQSNA